MNKKGNKKIFVAFGLCSFFALVLCMVTLVVTVRNVAETQAQSEKTGIQVSKTQLNDDAATLKQYLYNLTTASQGNKFIKASSYRDVYIDDASVLIDGEAHSNDKVLFVFAKNRIMSVVDAFYGEDYTGAFGTVWGKMPVINLLSQDARCTYSVGQADENGKQIFDDNGNLVDGDYYFISFNIDPASVKDSFAKKSVGLEAVADITGKLKEAIAADCVADFTSVEPESYVINAKINRLTDELSQLEIKRVYNVKADLEFVGKASVLGKKSAEFQYTVNEKYEYSYAGIQFVEDSFKAEAGDEISLNVNAVIENDSEYSVKFISSNNNVATVDEMGYVQVLKVEPVTITVQLEYLGNTFTDECVINQTDF